MELVVFAASTEAAFAAVQNGADEVLLSPSIPAEALGDFITYARLRGIVTALDCSRACGDAEMTHRALHLRRLYNLGLDAVFAGETGLLRMAASTAPDCKLTWSGHCHTSDDIRFAQSQKCVRAVLSPFLSSQEIQALAVSSAIPLALWALSPLCPGGDPNHCLLGKEHGLYDCGYDCRKTNYGFSGETDSLFLKTRELCLLGHLREFSPLTVLIAPPDNSPEAVGISTRIARSAADGGHYDERMIREVFYALGREAPTETPYTGVGSIYVSDSKQETRHERFWETERREAAQRPERACVPVRFFALITEGSPARLAVDDYRGHTVYVEGTPPLSDTQSPGAEEELNAVWNDVGGIYYCKDARTKIDAGLRLPQGEAISMRRRLMEKLEETRLKMPERKAGNYVPEPPMLPRADKPVFTVKVQKLSQVTQELLDVPPERLYIPLNEASNDAAKAQWLVESQTVPVAVFPRITTENDRTELHARLKRLHDIGFREALVWSPGQAVMAVREGFSPRADWAAASTQTLKASKMMGILSCTLAPWLTLQEIQELGHLTDTEMIVYGRLPLLLARQCLIRRKSDLCACDNINELCDGQGGLMPLERDAGHTTLVYHAQKLWLEPHRKQWRHIGLWAARLDFTTENARECMQVFNAFLGREDYSPHAYTTGFYLPHETKKGGGRRPFSRLG